MQIWCKASYFSDVLQGNTPSMPKGSAWEKLSLEQTLGILDSGNQLPSVPEFICILQKCRKRKDIEYAKRVYAHIRKNCLGDEIAVGNHVVPMFVDCGSVQDAHEIFNSLACRNVHSWTSLIGGYNQYGQFRDALQLYQKMQEDHICPNRCTLLALMKGCAKLDDVQVVHREITRNKFEEDLFVGSSLVDAYVKCGSLTRAREALDKLPARNVVSWNALIAGYAELGCGQEAIDCFEQMQKEKIHPDVVTFACILKSCGSIEALGKGCEIYTEVLKRGLEVDLSVGNTLIDMYANYRMMLEAQTIFDRLTAKSVVSWNALIGGYVEHGPPWRVLDCFEQMEKMGIFQSSVTFIHSLKACANLKNLNEGLTLHKKIAQGAFERDSFVASALIDMYAKCGSLVESCHVLYKLQTGSVVQWNALLAGSAECGRGEEAFMCFERMKLRDVSPNNVTFACILKACGSLRVLDKGHGLHFEIAAKGFEKDIFVGSALVDFYAKCGSLLDAQKVFDKLPVQNIVTWTALVSGYAEHGLGEETLDCFDLMRHKGIVANDAMYAPLLKACGIIGSVDRGQEIHTVIIKRGFERDLFIGNTSIDMYAKCNYLADAREVFESLPVKGVVSWNAMIRGYGINHQGKMALDVFVAMQEQGVKPDTVTFTCLLDACSHASLVCKGHELFKLMKEVYAIIPTVDHYACMVDLLARSGHLYEAEKYLKSMPCMPSRDTWIALMSACKTYAETEIGQRCFHGLVQMNPKKAGPYMLMESVYANAAMWEKAYDIAELRKNAKAKKKPATALIEVNSKLQEFIIGAEEVEELSTVMKTLTSRMEGQGHVPNLDLVLKFMV